MEAGVRPLSYIGGVQIAPPLPSSLFNMDDCIESQNILSWRAPARMSQPNSSVNSLYRDQTHDFSIVNTVL